MYITSLATDLDLPDFTFGCVSSHPPRVLQRQHHPAYSNPAGKHLWKATGANLYGLSPRVKPCVSVQSVPEVVAVFRGPVTLKQFFR